MSALIVVIEPNGKAKAVPFEGEHVPLETLQAGVGGYIEAVDVPGLAVTCWWNEEGLIKELPINEMGILAMAHLDVPLAQIYVGPVVITGRTDEGDAVGLSDPVLERLADVLGLQSSDLWWARRTVGETVHYHNAFGQWVRGEVIETVNGKEMRPTALVGAWKQHDLWTRDPTGEVDYGYHVEVIQESKAWQPTSTTMWESGSDYVLRQDDPTTMPALPLTPPELTKAEAREAAKHKVARAAQKVLDDTTLGIDERMAKAAALLTNPTTQEV